MTKLKSFKYLVPIFEMYKTIANSERKYHSCCVLKMNERSFSKHSISFILLILMVLCLSVGCARRSQAPSPQPKETPAIRDTKATPQKSEDQKTPALKATGDKEYDETAEAVAQLYGKICGNVFKAKSIKTAEAAKVIENVQRDLNIALTNELSLIFERLGINTGDVMDAASTKWNFHPYMPGMVGGHCIPVDPYYLVRKARELGYEPRVILAGRSVLRIEWNFFRLPSCSSRRRRASSLRSSSAGLRSIERLTSFFSRRASTIAPLRDRMIGPDNPK